MYGEPCSFSNLGKNAPCHYLRGWGNILPDALSNLGRESVEVHVFPSHNIIKIPPPTGPRVNELSGEWMGAEIYISQATTRGQGIMTVKALVLTD